MTVVAAYLYRDGKRVREVAIDERVDCAHDKSEFVWIGIADPSEDELRTLQNTYGLHPLAIEDALKADQLPKADVYGDQLFVVARTAHLEGEDNMIAYGETAIFVGHSHIISVRHGSSVTARGTIFDVAVTDNRVKVVLLRGIVEVRDGRARADTSQPAIARLRPGQQISFGTAEPLVAPQPAATIDAQWTAGMLSFDRTRLADAITEANRYSTAKISLADPALGDLRITGAFHAGDAVGLAESLAESLDLRAAKTPQGDVVISALPSQPAA